MVPALGARSKREAQRALKGLPALLELLGNLGGQTLSTGVLGCLFLGTVDIRQQPVPPLPLLKPRSYSCPQAREKIVPAVPS